MNVPILRRATAAVLSIALTLGAALQTAPAAADGHVHRYGGQQPGQAFPPVENPAGLIAALIALGVIASALDDDDDRAERRDRRPTTAHRRAGIDIPRACVRNARQGPRIVLGRCLRERGIRHVRVLPDRCRRQAPRHVAGRFVYRVPCLRHAGYRFR